MAKCLFHTFYYTKQRYFYFANELLQLLFLKIIENINLNILCWTFPFIFWKIPNIYYFFLKYKKCKLIIVSIQISYRTFKLLLIYILVTIFIISIASFILTNIILYKKALLFFRFHIVNAIFIEKISINLSQSVK